MPGDGLSNQNDPLKRVNCDLNDLPQVEIQGRLELRATISEAFRAAYLRFADNKGRQTSETRGQSGNALDPKVREQIKDKMRTHFEARVLEESLHHEDTTLGYTTAYSTTLAKVLDKQTRLNAYIQKNLINGEVAYDEVMTEDAPGSVRVILMLFLSDSAGAYSTDLENRISHLDALSKECMACRRAIFNRAIDKITDDTALSKKVLNDTFVDHDVELVLLQATRDLFPIVKMAELREALNHEARTKVSVIEQLAEILETHGDNFCGAYALAMRDHVEKMGPERQQLISQQLQKIYGDNFDVSGQS